MTARLGVTGPDGTPYGEVLDAVVWRKPPAPVPNLQAGDASLGLILERDDPPGRYRVHADVTDRVAGLTVNVERVVTAAEPNRTGR